MKKLKVIIACGSGAVTSSLCKNVVSEIAKDAGVQVTNLFCYGIKKPIIYV